MTVAEVQTPTQKEVDKVAGRASVVHEFSISVATKNGSGSQTASTTLLRALFKMGIPVSGKNVFPSNIQGMPTWYTIRVSRDNFIGRRPNAEVVVAMNPATALEDHQKVEPGGVFMYADDMKLPLNRTDLSYYPIPVKKIATENESD